MTTNVRLECTCGKMRGIAREVSPQTGMRVICVCDDCQAFARFLGRADTVMDRHGGTDIYQMAPSRFELTQGREHLRCVRLGPKGLMRWYAGCCNTPIGNTLAWAGMPFVGVPSPFMRHERSREADLGPPIATIHGRFAIGGEAAAGSHPKVPPGLIVRTLRFLASGALARRHRPSALFDAATGKPLVEATVLTREQRAALQTG